MEFNQDDVKDFDFSNYAFNISEDASYFENKDLDTEECKKVITKIRRLLMRIENKVKEIENV